MPTACLNSIGLKMHLCGLKMRVNYTTKLACGANATTPDAVVRLQIIEWTKIITHNQRDICKISDLADPYCTCIYAGALSPCDVDAHVHRGIHSDPHSWCCVRVMACFFQCLHAERDHSFLGMGFRFMGLITLKKEKKEIIIEFSLYRFNNKQLKILELWAIIFLVIFA